MRHRSPFVVQLFIGLLVALGIVAGCKPLGGHRKWVMRSNGEDVPVFESKDDLLGVWGRVYEVEDKMMKIDINANPNREALLNRIGGSRVAYFADATPVKLLRLDPSCNAINECKDCEAGPGCAEVEMLEGNHSGSKYWVLTIQLQPVLSASEVAKREENAKTAEETKARDDATRLKTGFVGKWCVHGGSPDLPCSQNLIVAANGTGLHVWHHWTGRGYDEVPCPFTYAIDGNTVAVTYGQCSEAENTNERWEIAYREDGSFLAKVGNTGTPWYPDARQQ